jgi:7-carboxy-7-deazaguanine synthase
MKYSVKEMFYTLQGEGAQSGRAAVFCRFAGCNLWSGREQDRVGAVCNFCDTDFVGTDGPGGGKFARAQDLAAALAALWRAGVTPGVAPGAAPGQAATAPPVQRPFLVCTGGEPLLQLDAALVAALHAQGFEIAVETNGTQLPPEGVDWICVSPKAGAPLVLAWGDELKLVYPQPGAPPEDFAGLDFAHFLLQPMDGPCLSENTMDAVAYCMAHPQWQLSLQTHKMLGIP